MVGMKINDSISKKLLKVCAEKKISVNRLAVLCCLTQSTVQNIIDGNSKNPKILTLVRICDGLNITLKEFFDDELFTNLDRDD